MAPKGHYKAKQSISLEKLKVLAKARLPEPNALLYNSDDIVTVVSCHRAFLQAVAPHTNRLNTASRYAVAKDIFKLGNRGCDQYDSATAIRPSCTACLLATRLLQGRSSTRMS